MKKQILLIVTVCTLFNAGIYADFRKRFEEFRASQQTLFDSTRSEQQKIFDEFRRQQNQKYVTQLRSTWEKHDAVDILQSQEFNRLIPDSLNNVPSMAEADMPISTNAHVLYIPHSDSQPQPIVPIQPTQQTSDFVSIAFYGTLISIPFPLNADLYLRSIDENGIATLWEDIADVVIPSKFDVTLAACLSKRAELNLCDWAYLQMIQAVAKRRYGNSNEATIFAAYLMTQSGYKIRLAFTDVHVYMLLASHHEIYGMTRYLIDNEYYYMVDGKGAHTCYISNVGYHEEKKISLFIRKELKIDSEPSDIVFATSSNGWSLPVQVNTNLIDFYNDYPTCGVFYGDQSSKWLIGVNTPLDAVTKSVLYPQIQKSIQDFTTWEAVSMILNWVQTAFEYELDNEVWGGDRMFFSEETLYYPTSDCEDRAILFTTLIRDIIGLDMVLLYYENPAHVATAVHFPMEESEGKYIVYNGRRYMICDPTLKNAPIGWQMSGVANCQAQIIVLNN